jgi:hypothetical protein
MIPARQPVNFLVLGDTLKWRLGENLIEDFTSCAVGTARACEQRPFYITIMMQNGGNAPKDGGNCAETNL